MAIDFTYIRSFLLKWESRFLRGYIPCKRRNYFGADMHRGETDPRYGKIIGASGVTIGTGVDLGQTSASKMRADGVPENIISLFTPYFRKTKYSAAAELYAKPLTISDSDCDILDEIVHNSFVKYAQKRFDTASEVIHFADCPREAQAVIVSLFYQLGSPPRYKRTWEHLIKADWSGAAHELETGFMRYTNRRHDEGKLLEAIHG